MDIKAYIESGILEQYVIGTLSAAEMAEVERNIKLYPEIANEIKAIEITLEAYARHQGIAPKLTEEKLIENLHQTKLKPSSATDTRSGIKGYYLLGWLLSLALIAYLLYSESSKSKLNSINKQNQLIIDSIRIACNETATQNEILNRKIQLLNNPKSKFLLLAGTNLSPNSFASVIIDSINNKLVFDFAGLPMPPAGKQFQLWVFKGGVPIDMGVINNEQIGSIHNVEKDFIAEAQAFALTLEDEGGKPSPTLEQMYVIGSL